MKGFCNGAKLMVPHGSAGTAFQHPSSVDAWIGIRHPHYLCLQVVAATLSIFAKHGHRVSESGVVVCGASFHTIHTDLAMTGCQRKECEKDPLK